MKLLLLSLAIFFISQGSAESLSKKNMDTSVYNTKKNEINRQASENKKIKCRYVCDKKVYKEQKISEAIEFYKNSKDYKFSRD
ncbi:MAG: hypothetical protein A2513_00855 [Sulfurimonas sp. RIFOXYD12_FULL_33_39]|nr:MAG: hypothetical protein A2513_00855 [Sulfurimonas sp. RIFOXYD12_FULL_33_39]OHE13520.1 MAG: hypothetical protein A2530_07325 [Sulfurimonas sp. RIFOXYD2_FULL_34_21]DAB27843.1 MAG TPA: hypothetical protein CFH78_05635 [Sulfurimonas sp. UBA10385]